MQASGLAPALPSQELYEYEAWSGQSTPARATKRNNATRASKGFYLAVVADSHGCYTATLMRNGVRCRPAELNAESYAFVKLREEPHLRVALMSAKFGEAAGHPHLAAEAAVAYAGEVQFEDEGKIKRWSNMSGTYKCAAAGAEQAGLPMENFYAVHPPPGTHEIIPTDCVLTTSRVLLKPACTYSPPA